MPDLLTHLATGYLAAIPVWRRLTFRWALLWGVVLPDLLTRPFYILLGRYVSDVGKFVAPLHTPLGYVLAVAAVVQIFDRRDQQRAAFCGLLGGGLLHFAADALQRHVVGGYFWLFPCLHTSTWGLFWPETTIRWLPLSAAVIVCVHFGIRIWNRSRQPGNPGAS